jgi:hypothetical protein
LPLVCCVCAQVLGTWATAALLGGLNLLQAPKDDE